MTRFEFVNRLNSRLYLLKESERRDIIDEYIGHIDLKMKEGKTEAEAIKDFGDIEELAREILGAYHIDSTKVEEKTIDIYVKQIFDYFNRVTEKILGLSTAQLAGVFVEFVVLLIILNLMRIPVNICVNMFAHLFLWLPMGVYQIVYGITDIIINLAFIVIAFIFIYQFINKRIIAADYPEEDTEKMSVRKKQACETETAEKPEKLTEKIHRKTAKLKEKSRLKGIIKSTAGKTGENISTAVDRTGGFVKRMAGSTGDFVINLSILIIRIMLFVCLWLPCAALTLAGIICTVLACIIYFSTGIGFMGVCISGVGCCIMGGGFTLWLTHMLTGGKTENA